MTGQRYVLVQDDDCHWYVIHADRLDDWHSLSDDAINDGPAWVHRVGGAPSLVTFQGPEISGRPTEFH